jgi:type IV fimbrial biogenesis protein FimT
MRQQRRAHLLPTARPLWPARGFTLVELLVTIALAAILMTIAIPSFQYTTSAYRIAGQVGGLITDVQFARAEAIKEGQTVTVCVSSDGATCSTNTGNWQVGWIVFSDVNANQIPSSSAAVLRAQAALAGGNTFADTSATAAISFNRQGFLTGLSSGLTLAMHDPTNNPNLTRCVAINPVGRALPEHQGTGNCL